MTRFSRIGVGSAAIVGVLAALLVLLLMGTPANADEPPPLQTPDLYGPVTTHNSVTLKWWDYESPSTSGISYEVLRRIDGEYVEVSGSYSALTRYLDGTVGIRFTETGLQPDTGYSYRVVATRGSARSGAGKVYAKTDPAPEGHLTPEATPEATPEVTPEPTAEPTSEPTAEPTSEPTAEPTTETTTEPTTEPTTETTTEPTTEPTTETTPENQDDNSATEEVVTNNEKPSKIEEIDGGEEDPVLESPSVTRSSVGSSSVNLEWTAPAGAAPTGYRIWMKTGDSASAYQFYGSETTIDDEGIATTTTVILATLQVSDTTSTSTSAMITGLAANTLHHFWIAALYGTEDPKTQGLISNAMSLRTDPAIKAPSAVRNLRVLSVENSGIYKMVDLYWDVPEAHVDCPVDGYKVDRWSLSGDSASYFTQTSTQVRWRAESNDTYVFTVTARCGGDFFGESKTVTLVTGPIGVRPPEPDPYLAIATATQVELKWFTDENPRDNNWGFEIERSETHDSWSVVSGTYAGGSTTEPGGYGYSNGGFTTIWYDRSIEPDTFYTYRITTVDRDNSNLKSETSRLVTAQTLIATTAGTPDGPLNVRTGLVLTSPNAVRIMWDPPDDTGSTAITGYQILRNNSVLVTDTGNTNTTYDDTDVEEGRRYLYMIRAINTQGAGLRSRIASGSGIWFSTNPSPGTTVHTRPDRAGTVTAVITNNTTDSTSSVTVTWTDGTVVGDRVCHSDYYLVRGILQTDGTHRFLHGAPWTVDNPDITVAGKVYLLNFQDPIGPYARSYTKAFDYVWTTDDSPGTGEKALDWKLRVYCGHPLASDSAQIGEDTTPTISS